MAAQDPTDAVQAGLYSLLTGDATLMALVVGVYDGVPESASQPYLTLGEASTTPDGVHGTEGRQTSATVHTWTRRDGFKTANEIGARVVALLDHRHTALDAVVAGHQVWRVAHEFSQTMGDPEPHVRHRVDRFRIWTSQD